MNMIKVSGTSWYSIFNALGYLAAAIIFYLEAKRKQFSFEALLYVLFGALLGGLIGSRLGSALFVYQGYYSRHFLDLFVPQVGGKTLVGGLIGGYIGVVIAKKVLKFDRSTGDLFAPGLAIGIAIGRIGCFLNGCCYGAPTKLPWGVAFNGVISHPAQLYESVFCFILFFHLWSIRGSIKKEGDLFKIFLIWYVFFRFWIEFLRADKVILGFNLSIAQVICGVVFIVLASYFLRSKKRGIE
jgi:phosphatidylglycerol---prolipoprotein diacylglyceryl transferase